MSKKKVTKVCKLQFQAGGAKPGPALRNKECENMEIPVVFVDNLKSERWKNLYEFWRSL